MYQISYLDNRSQKTRSLNLDGISSSERREILKKRHGVEELEWFQSPSPKFQVGEQDGFAVLTISRSFYDPAIDPAYDSLLQAAFSQIRKKNINNLVLDLRNNEGGSEHQQSELMSYLYDQPFKLYENIYVSRLDYRPLKSIISTSEKDTSRLLDSNEDEWMRKISDNLWINNYAYYDGLQLQAPKKNTFRGNLFVLMNGICFSSASALIANIKNTTKAVFIGEESGGTYEGPTGGSTIPIILPHSGIMVRLSPNLNIGYLYKKHPFGRGVMPDFPVHYTIQEILGKRDLEMEVADKLIRSKIE